MPPVKNSVHKGEASVKKKWIVRGACLAAVCALTVTGVAAASSGTAHFSSSAWVAASAPPRAPKYRAACARSMRSGFSSRSGILGPMLICPPSFTRIKNRLSIQHRGPAVNDFKISNFFAINLLTIWVNRDIIQTTNPPT